MIFLAIIYIGTHNCSLMDVISTAIGSYLLEDFHWCIHHIKFAETAESLQMNIEHWKLTVFILLVYVVNSCSRYVS